jgi:hypothetical protein
MGCLCGCGRVIDCGQTLCDICEDDQQASTGFYVLPPEELPHSGLRIEQEGNNARVA